ncbi:MAG: hypothetical protein ABJB02_06470 [Dokdonella sp.]
MRDLATRVYSMPTIDNFVREGIDLRPVSAPAASSTFARTCWLYPIMSW